MTKAAKIRSILNQVVPDSEVEFVLPDGTTAEVDLTESVILEFKRKRKGTNTLVQSRLPKLRFKLKAVRPETATVPA